MRGRSATIVTSTCCTRQPEPAQRAPPPRAASRSNPFRVRRIAIGEHLADVAGRRRAEDGVGDGVRDGVAVGMAFEVHVARNRNAAKDQRAGRREPVRVVADADARSSDVARLLGHAGAGGRGVIPHAQRRSCRSLTASRREFQNRVVLAAARRHEARRRESGAPSRRVVVRCVVFAAETTFSSIMSDPKSLQPKRSAVCPTFIPIVTQLD